MRSIYVIGCGHMGEAILSALRAKFGVDCLRAIDADPDRVNKLSSQGYNASNRVADIDARDVAVLAVPPQQFEVALIDHPLLLAHRGPIISIMAGVTLSTLKKSMRHSNIVRAIPNTPSEVGQGITLYYLVDPASPELINLAELVFSALGIAIRVDAERKIDSGTALVGGGPALVCYFANSLQKYAETGGFDKETARLISGQLLYGTSMMMRLSKKSSLQLCKEVQTVGGTTEQAINYLNSNGFNKLVLDALFRAQKRAVELGDGLS